MDKKYAIIISALIIGAYLIGGILMSKTYGYDEAKCEHEVIKKDNIEVLEFTLGVPSGGSVMYGKEYGVYDFYLPEGFTNKNTVILGEIFDENSTTLQPNADNGIEAPITFLVFSEDNMLSLFKQEEYSLISYKVVLYKYKD